MLWATCTRTCRNPWTKSWRGRSKHCCRRPARATPSSDRTWMRRWTAWCSTARPRAASARCCQEDSGQRTAECFLLAGFQTGMCCFSSSLSLNSCQPPQCGCKKMHRAAYGQPGGEGRRRPSSLWSERPHRQDTACRRQALAGLLAGGQVGAAQLRCPSTCLKRASNSFFAGRFFGRRMLLSLSSHPDFNKILEKYVASKDLQAVRDTVLTLKAKVERVHHRSVK